MKRAGVSILVGALVGLASAGDGGSAVLQLLLVLVAADHDHDDERGGHFRATAGLAFLRPLGRHLRRRRIGPRARPRRTDRGGLADCAVAVWRVPEYGLQQPAVGVRRLPVPTWGPYGSGSVGVVPSGPSGTGAFYGDPGATYVVPDLSTIVPGELRPSSFYGPQTDLPPGRGRPPWTRPPPGRATRWRPDGGSPIPGGQAPRAGLERAYPLRSADDRSNGRSASARHHLRDPVIPRRDGR